MRIDHYIRVSIIRGPGFSRWNACRDRADSQESLIRLKPRLLSGDIRMKHSKSSNPSAQKRVPRPWFGSGHPVGNQVVGRCNKINRCPRWLWLPWRVCPTRHLWRY